MGQTVNSGSSAGLTSSACMQPGRAIQQNEEDLPPELAKNLKTLEIWGNLTIRKVSVSFSVACKSWRCMQRDVVRGAW
jgi:hypothetical protein